MSKSFYTLSIPTPFTLLRWVGNLLYVIAAAILYTLFAPTWLLAHTVDRGTKGGLREVAGILVVVVGALNMGAILSLAVWSVDPSHEVVSVEMQDGVVYMDIEEQHSDLAKWYNPQKRDTIQEFVYDPESNRWFRIFGIHAALVKDGGWWSPTVRHNQNGWTSHSLDNRLNQWAGNHRFTIALRDLRKDIKSTAETRIESLLDIEKN